MTDETTPVEIDSEDGNIHASAQFVTEEGCLSVEVVGPPAGTKRSLIIPLVGQALPVTIDYIASELTAGMPAEMAMHLTIALVNRYPDMPMVV
jgi:hypothetical protein